MIFGRRQVKITCFSAFWSSIFSGSALLKSCPILIKLWYEYAFSHVVWLMVVTFVFVNIIICRTPISKLTLKILKEAIPREINRNIYICVIDISKTLKRNKELVSYLIQLRQIMYPCSYYVSLKQSKDYTAQICTIQNWTICVVQREIKNHEYSNWYIHEMREMHGNGCH